ncbi:hypothetical protein DFJ43DRAFT_1036977 [Lentinula guzmanii]|uniref:Uncharacterized protein n=1 Tax=Lentinula guzmanii TaxID=2804957 RepID=A0AA38JR18_9AGAR|nr:hypothetical protein DFJ43DRAFT_1036977 [Lentinula guzmanii]
MSTNPNNSETIQQRRERILQAQAARQRAREEEIARQEAEFAAEMERIEAEEKIAREAEEKAAREAEEKRKAEEQRIEEERRRKEERRVAEEKRIAEERRKKQEELVEARKQEEKQRRAEERLAEEAAAAEEEERERASAFAKLVEENKKEKERAAEDLEKRRKHTTKPHRGINVEIPVPPSGSRRKIFKSKAVISDDSDEEGDGKSKESAPRGVKRKRTIKMIAKGDSNSVPEGRKFRAFAATFRLHPLCYDWPTFGVSATIHATTGSSMRCLSPTTSAMQLVWG